MPQETKKSDEIKRINIKEFREQGFLQEINRQFLHPLGMALEVNVKEDGEDSDETLRGIWDYRDDDEGMIYALKESKDDRKQRFFNKAMFVAGYMTSAHEKRRQALGFVVEPIVHPEGEGGPNVNDHKVRHQFLHQALDELVADYMSEENILPSKVTVMDLIKWSNEQTHFPKGSE